jgi:hypothetical protein
VAELLCLYLVLSMYVPSPFTIVLKIYCNTVKAIKSRRRQAGHVARMVEM